MAKSTDQFCLVSSADAMKRINKLTEAYLDEVEVAPTKSGWNSMLKKPVHSKRQVTQAYQNNLQNIIALCPAIAAKVEKAMLALEPE
tara:strand:- start:177 stop:437 length:261 start_codon:yes stop_codon:yes gene_type:complete